MEKSSIMPSEDYINKFMKELIGLPAGYDNPDIDIVYNMTMRIAQHFMSHSDLGIDEFLDIMFDETEDIEYD